MKSEIEKLLPELKELKSLGENIQQYLESRGFPQGTPEVIEVAYDLQAGDDYDIYSKYTEFADKFCIEILNEIYPHIQGGIDSMLDCGTGEGTTLFPFLKNFSAIFGYYPDRISAFDISAKRMEVMREKFGCNLINLLKADMRDIPFLDNSFDLVTTFHSIEPNFFDSERIFNEVIRVSKKYILLVEPVYEYASQEQKDRMDEFKYFRGLPSFLDSNNVVEVLTTHKMENNINPLNKAHVIFARKK